MNKPLQPLTGPTSAPHPAPSPGLTQAAYAPGQPPSLVFATPPPQQMNPAPQPRQPYYQNRPAMPSSAPRVQTSSGPRPVGPTHVYQTGSQMMMIPQQQLSFAGSPQSYFIPPGQYRTPYMAPAQQYPVTSGTAGFYPGTSPAEYTAYAGAYYPAQPQYSPSVQPTPVMITTQQQQQAPPPQQPPAQPQGPPKRERKPIRIRDPNQGGRDITEEIMAGGRSTSTPTPPQASLPDGGGPAQTNGEVTQPIAMTTRTDETAATAGTPRSPVSSSPEPAVEAGPETDTQRDPLYEQTIQSEVVASIEAPISPGKDQSPAPSPSPPSAPTRCSPTPPSEPTVAPPAIPQVCDTVDAPVTLTMTSRVQEHPSNQDSPDVTLAVSEKPAVQEEKIKEEKDEAEMTVGEEPADASQSEVETAVQQMQAPLAAVNSENVTPPSKEETEASACTDAIVEPLIGMQGTAAPANLTRAASLQGSPEAEAMPTYKAELPLSNGLPQDLEELSEEVPQSECGDTKSPAEVDGPQPQEPTSLAGPTTLGHNEEEEEEEKTENLHSASCPTGETTMHAAVSVPKKKRNMKELNKKEAIGDLLDAFKEEQEAKPAPEPQAEPAPSTLAALPAEVSEETWEEKEDKQNSEPETSEPKSAVVKYQYKGEQWKPIDPEDKKRYDREFLLGFQFSSASMHKPEGLPLISDVVLDKANKTPLRPADPGRLMNTGPDFTPSFLGNLGRQSTGPRGPPPGPRRSQQGQRKEPRKIITSMSLCDDVQLNKAEKAWKPSAKKLASGRGLTGAEESEDEDPEQVKTQELFKRVRSVLNKLTPQMFQQLMKQVTDLTIDTEERLKGVIDLIFEKAISEPNFSVAYANMCRCLMGLKVPTTDKPGVTVNFRKLLLNRCQKEFEKDQDDDEIFERKQKEMEAAKEEERASLKAELEEAKDKARRRSLGNIKFIGELFKLKMLTEAIMHDCVVKLLKNHDEESLECLCRLLSTIGKDLDFEKAKPRMDQYFNQMDKIIKERKTSSRIRFMLQDVLDLRRCNWIPRRGDQGPKTIDQIHKEAELEEHREQIKVQQQLLNKKDGGGGGRMVGGGSGGRGGPHTPGGGRGSQPQDEGWNTVPISTKNRPIDTSRLSKITKPGALDFNNQLLAPGGKGMWGSWGKGSSGGTGAKQASGGEQEPGRPATSTVNRFSALQQSAPPSSSSSDADRRVPLRSSSSRDRVSDRFERPDSREERSARPPVTKRSFSRETEERGGRGGEGRSSAEPVRRVASMTDDRDRGSRDRAPSKEPAVKRENAPSPPSKPAMTEEELDKKSNAIIEEYLHINDMKEALQCVAEMNSGSLLFVFVRNGVESTLERSTIARQHMGLLLHQLYISGSLTAQQYYQGLQEILEVAEDMAIDIPHIWLYLAELITPMLHEGGIPMGQLFREISKPLVPLGKAGVLLVEMLTLLCKEMTHKKVGGQWREGGLNWSDFLAKDEDINKFVTEQKVEFTLGEKLESEETNEKKLLSGEELSKQLDRLIQDKANNQRIRDWVEANLDEQHTVSNTFVRALMTSVCQSAIICENPYKVDVSQITQRASLLQRYLSDEQKELQALYALQALMVHMEQPANLLRMFFDTLYDEDVIKEEAFYKWESSKDPAEQTGKGVALKSVTAFFTWLREAEEESDKD
ncbi:eukaryotic translation initiation factor 4 gamma 1a isoform X2 [Hypomesus transpacificus]|uniref:eukaryotic translation initiation factor 4 gamma 1a isoform X2 n=1 Tax=Hypomesus transpacificus TaxID=137520 RepID=UPI001F07DE79|nr:eukaryotic translation initiation factor 4 gamma 1a isoform X2 [Hypomesus transpacificus]